MYGLAVMLLAAAGVSVRSQDAVAVVIAGCG